MDDNQLGQYLLSQDQVQANTTPPMSAGGGGSALGSQLSQQSEGYSYNDYPDETPVWSPATALVTNRAPGTMPAGKAIDYGPPLRNATVSGPQTLDEAMSTTPGEMKQGPMSMSDVERYAPTTMHDYEADKQAAPQEQDPAHDHDAEKQQFDEATSPDKWQAMTQNWARQSAAGLNPQAQYTPVDPSAPSGSPGSAPSDAKAAAAAKKSKSDQQAQQLMGMSKQLFNTSGGSPGDLLSQWTNYHNPYINK